MQRQTAYRDWETNSKLKVSFFRPFYGDYWILDLDYDPKRKLNKAQILSLASMDFIRSRQNIIS